MTEVTANVIHLLTVGSDPQQMKALDASCQYFGMGYTNLLDGGKVWRGGDMYTTGGGHKINLVKNWIDKNRSKEAFDDDIILFVDGYDVVFCDDLPTIAERFLGFDCDILFAAEKECWPSPDLAELFPETENRYRFINSGLYIGRLSKIRQFLQGGILDEEDDQNFIHTKYISGSGVNVLLDTEAYVFQCDDDIMVSDKRLINLHTNTSPCVYHGNGGRDAKERFSKVVTQMSFAQQQDEIPMPVGPDDIYSPPVIEHVNLEYEEVAQDILLVDFMPEDLCKRYIAASESLGRWGELDGDKFPAQEIRLKEIGLWDEISEQWSERLGKICEKHWHPEAYLGLRDAFTMRYSMDTQTELGLHTDASLFTGSVKLNNDYAGAELVFPRQNFSNKDVKVGQCILFPSMVTHGHKVLPLRGGKKYSLTMWTSRYDGDVNS